MGSLFDDLEGRSDSEIRALMGSLDRVKVSRVKGSARSGIKIKNSRVHKSMQGLEPEMTNLNETVTLVIEMPAYMVAGVRELAMDSGQSVDRVVHMALREWLNSKGKVWWHPRFLAAGRAGISRAKDQFTSKFG